MTEFRILERCGLPVGEAGNPCMRVSGHSGVCIDGRTPTLPPISDSDIPSPFKIPKPVIVISVVLYLILALQIFIDVILLTSRS